MPTALRQTPRNSQDGITTSRKYEIWWWQRLDHMHRLSTSVTLYFHSMKQLQISSCIFSKFYWIAKLLKNWLCSFNKFWIILEIELTLSSRWIVIKFHIWSGWLQVTSCLNCGWYQYVSLIVYDTCQHFFRCCFLLTS